MTGRQFSLIMALALAISLFGGMATTIRAGDTEIPLLRGLKEVFVEVEALDFRAEREGLTTEHLRADAVNKLKMAGMKVQSEKESMTTPGNPRLHIMVKVLGTATGDYAAHIRVELREAVSLVRHPGMEVGYWKIWCDSFIIRCQTAGTRTDRQVYQRISSGKA